MKSSIYSVANNGTENQNYFSNMPIQIVWGLGFGLFTKGRLQNEENNNFIDYYRLSCNVLY
jgi:hypothetical protein